MSVKDKKRLVRLIYASLFLISFKVFTHLVISPLWFQALLYLIPYLLAGYDVLLKALKKIIKGKVFSEHFLMAIATLGAFALSFIPNGHPEFDEAVFVMIFYQIGELFEHIAEGSSKKSIAALLEMRPEQVHLLQDDGTEEVSPESLKIGNLIEIYQGEKVPVDGIVVKGRSQLNAVALTGESLPLDVTEGDHVLSGMVNLNGLLRVKVEKTMENSTLSQILDLMQDSKARQSKNESFIANFASIYTPLVVITAVFLALIPPFLIGNFASQFPIWLHRALTFLVISCPCALVISIPMAFFGGLGAASKIGVLIKGSSDLEKLAKLNTLIVDKTGTLTKGQFEVSDIHAQAINQEELLHLASHAEQYSSHPIAQSLKGAYDNEDDCVVENVVETAGQGVEAQINHQDITVGNAKYMDNLDVDWKECHNLGTLVHVAVDGDYAGHIIISDHLKEDTEEAIHRLRKDGIHQIIMLTGDREDVAENVAQTLGLEAFHAELSPIDKVNGLDYYMKLNEKGYLAFVGDGINDAPVLARSDIGVAMGGLGSQAAIEAADVVIMNDSLMSLSRAIGIARKTVRIARENAIFSILVKLIVLSLAALGLASMWLAIFADVGVTVLAVLNALRCLHVKSLKFN